MSPQEIAAIIEHHCASQDPPVPVSEFLANPAPRSNRDRIPKLRAAVGRELFSKGLRTVTISKIFRQPWTTTAHQLRHTKP